MNFITLKLNIDIAKFLSYQGFVACCQTAQAKLDPIHEPIKKAINICF